MTKRERPGKKFVGAYIDEWLYLVLQRRAELHNTNISVELIKLLLGSQGFLKLDRKGVIIECSNIELVDDALKHFEKISNTNSTKSVARLLTTSHRLIRQVNYIQQSEGKKTFTLLIKREPLDHH